LFGWTIYLQVHVFLQNFEDLELVLLIQYEQLKQREKSRKNLLKLKLNLKFLESLVKNVPPNLIVDSTNLLRILKFDTIQRFHGARYTQRYRMLNLVYSSLHKRTVMSYCLCLPYMTVKIPLNVFENVQRIMMRL